MRSFLEPVFQGLVNTLVSPVRLFGNALAIALGIAVFVAAVSLGSTAERQVAADFDVLRATEVRVSLFDPGEDFPSDYARRLEQVAGVEEVERFARYGDVEVASHGPGRQDLARRSSVQLYGVDAGGPKALEVAIEGQFLDASMLWVDTSQALVGSRVASQLGLGVFDGTQAVWIGGRPYTIRGIIRDGGRIGGLRDGVVLLNAEAASLAGLGEAQLIIQTMPGAAAAVAGQAALALRPDAPASVLTVAPPDPGDFRLQIEGRVRTALLAIAAITTLVGALVIANSMAMAVIARKSEIGLRRALGATGREIFIQFTSESVMVGAVGGVIGGSLGVIAAVAISQSSGWNPIIDPNVPLIGPLIGIVIGAAAGLFPSIRAVRMDPVEALRSSS